MDCISLLRCDAPSAQWAFPEQKCNPFAVDVWCLAYLVRGLFTEGFELDPPHEIDGFEFLHELLADMSDEDPAKRPTMDKVVNRFTKIKSGFSEWKLRSRFVWDKKPFVQQLYFTLDAYPSYPLSVVSN